MRLIWMIPGVLGAALVAAQPGLSSPPAAVPTHAAIAQAERTADAADDRAAPISGFVEAGSVRLHYLDWGGRGEALVFIAGSGDNAHAFDGLAPEFTDRFRVLALTRRGSGESDKPETGYDVTTLTDDVRTFLQHMGIARASFVGHSAGGNELIELAVRHSQLVSRLVFLDAAYDRRDLPAIEAKDPLFERPWPDVPVSQLPLKDRIDAQYFAHMDQYAPDFASIAAPALSYYVMMSSHPEVTAETDEATRKKAQAFVEQEIQPRTQREIERFRREVALGQVIVLHGTDHYFFADPAQRPEVVREMRAFLAGGVVCPDLCTRP